MKMNFNNCSSWYPLSSMCRGQCHFDWMLGTTRFFGTRDFLNPSKVIGKNESVLWNRTFGKSVSVETYREIQKTRDPDAVRKCEETGLPLDVKI